MPLNTTITSRRLTVPVFVAILAGVAALVLGTLAGAWFGMKRGPKSGAAEAASGEREAEKPQGGSSTGASTATSGADGAKLREAEAEIERLRGRIAELEKQVPKPRSLEEKTKHAHAMIDLFRKASNDDESAVQAFLAGFSQLDQDVSGVFLKLARETEDEEEFKAALMLASVCGGPEVAAYLLERIEDTSSDLLKRSLTLRALEGGVDLFTLAKIPVEGRLAEQAFELAGSASKDERAAGAGLLSRIPTAKAREVLLAIAENEKESDVRRTAFRSMIAIGDKDTLAWFEVQLAQPDIERSPYREDFEQAVALLRQRLGN